MYTVIYSSFITKYAKFTRRRPKIKPPEFFGLILEPKCKNVYSQWLICNFVIVIVAFIYIFGSEIYLLLLLLCYIRLARLYDTNNIGAPLYYPIFNTC